MIYLYYSSGISDIRHEAENAVPPPDWNQQDLPLTSWLAARCVNFNLIEKCVGMSGKSAGKMIHSTYQRWKGGIDRRGRSVKQVSTAITGRSYLACLYSAVIMLLHLQFVCLGNKLMQEPHIQHIYHFCQIHYLSPSLLGII